MIQALSIHKHEPQHIPDCVSVSTCRVGLAGVREAVCRLLPLCLLHHSREVRHAAVSSCRAVLTASPSLMGDLLAGLRHWANNTQEALLLVVSAARA